MPDETVEVKTADVIIVEDEADEVEAPEVEEVPEVEEPKPEPKPKKAKKAKPAKGVGRKEKGKGAEKGFSKGDAWWKDTGSTMTRKGHSGRNIVLKASQAAGVPFDKFVAAMRLSATIEEKAKSLFDS